MVTHVLISAGSGANHGFVQACTGSHVPKCILCSDVPNQRPACELIGATGKRLDGIMMSTALCCGCHVQLAPDALSCHAEQAHNTCHIKSSLDTRADTLCCCATPGSQVLYVQTCTAQPANSVSGSTHPALAGWVGSMRRYLGVLSSVMNRQRALRSSSPLPASMLVNGRPLDKHGSTMQG